MGLVDGIAGLLSKPRQILENYRRLKQVVEELKIRTARLEQGQASQGREIGQLQADVKALGQEAGALREDVGSVPVPSVMETDGIVERKRYLEDGAAAPDPSMDAFYLHIADVFRGKEEDIREQVAMFYPYVEEACARNPELPFLDFGCGRGEFLDLLREKGVPCIGVDMNRASAQRAMDQGHEVVIGDALQYLESREDASLSGISMVMVSEHIEFQRMYESLFLFARKIAPEGALLINTINPYCYRRYGHFHLDPSHVNYMPPELYKLAMELAGFQGMRIVWSAPVRRISTPHELFMQYENVTIVGYRRAER